MEGKSKNLSLEDSLKHEFRKIDQEIDQFFKEFFGYQVKPPQSGSQNKSTPSAYELYNKEPQDIFKNYKQTSTSYFDPERPDVFIIKTEVDDGKGVRTTISENGKVVSSTYRKK